MSNNGNTFACELYRYRRLTGDRAASLLMHTSTEVTSDDIKFLDENLGSQCLVYVSTVPAGLEVPKIDVEKLKASMVQNKVYDKNISPSQRQRRKIWVLYTKQHGKEPTQEEFEKYYMKWMNKIDSTLAEKIAEYEEL